MMADSYYSKPQREEYFVDSGFYKYHEAYHLLKFANEKQILEKAYADYENREEWAKKMLVNISKAGFFSSDRTISQYNDEIWHLSEGTK